MQLTAAIGKRVKGWRESAGVRQDDVATAARACGLSWGRSTVAMFESGKRRIDPEELLLLPIVLQVAQVGSFTLLELLAGDAETLDLTETTSATRAELEKLLDPEGGPATMNLSSWTFPGKLLSGAQVMEVAVERARWRRRGLTAEQVEVVTREAAGEAERGAARRLGVTPYEVAAAARRLWGHSLTAVRDVRAQAAVEAGAGSLRAVRGHVTRELLDELRAHLEGAR